MDGLTIERLHTSDGRWTYDITVGNWRFDTHDWSLEDDRCADDE